MSATDPASPADYRTDPLGAAQQGTNPTVLHRMSSGWAVMGNTQLLPGYCVLLYDGVADQLTDLPLEERMVFMRDLVLLGEAVERACRAADPGFWRINYEVLGNTWPHLHGHIRPRYRWEPDHLRTGPVYLYGRELDAAEHRLSARHDSLRDAVARSLQDVLAEEAQRSHPPDC